MFCFNACADWGLLLRKYPNHGFTYQNICLIKLLSQWPHHGILLWMFWNPLQKGMIGCCSSRYLYCICFKISMWKFIYKQAYICRQFTEYKFIKYQKHWHSFPCWLIGCSLSVHSQLPWSLFTAELVYYRFSLSHTNKHACANMNLSAQKIYCYACLHLIGFISATNKIMTGSQCYITWIHNRFLTLVEFLNHVW